MDSAASRERKRSLSNQASRPDCKRARSIKGSANKIADWVKSKQNSEIERTPTKDASQNLDNSLHGSAVRRACRDAQTPLKLKETTARLPASYALLVDIYGKLQTVYMLYKRRQQQCTFMSAKRPVEECCGRSFTVHHLLQIKHAHPKAVLLNCSTNGLPQTPGSAAKKESQIFIEIPHLSGPRCQSAAQELRQQLAGRLMEAVESEHRRCHPSCAVRSKDWSQCGFDPETCPALPAADLPQPQKTSIACPSPAAGSPSARAPCTPATSHPKPTPLSSSRKPPTVPRASRPMAKRLSFGAPGEEQQQSGGANSSLKQQTSLREIIEEGSESRTEQTLAKQLRRQSMDGSIPVSLQALQAVRQASEEQAVMYNEEAVMARREATAAMLLPKLFDSLRAAFGPTGPSVMPLQKVLHKLTGGRMRSTDVNEMDFNVRRLADHLPEYLTIEIRAEQGEVVRINRRLDPKTLRDRLTELVKPV